MQLKPQDVLHDAHVESLTLVAHKLLELDVEMVFTGGAVVGLLLTDPGAPHSIT